MIPNNALPFAGRAATRILEHMTSGTHRDALSGHLLKELRTDRSSHWHRRQVIAAVAIELWERLRDYARPIIFFAGWSTLYPLWTSSAAAASTEAHPAAGSLSPGHTFG